MVVATLNMIRIDRRLRESLQLQLYRQVRQAIMSGALIADVRLPSTRELAAQLGLARNTIVNAFDRLSSEGYLESRLGSGIYVARLRDVHSAPNAAHGVGQVRGGAKVPRRLSNLCKAEVSPSYPGSKVRPFRPCQPAVDLFPLRNWNRARSYALRLQAKEIMCEVGAGGLPRLRRALATYLRDSRGVRCEAEQIVITAGAQEALSLIGELLVESGDRVWIEDPGYLGARAAFLRTGARLLPIPVDREGMSIPVMKQKPRVIYTTPSRQFPLGVTMSLSRRLALLDFARNHKVWIVEDDYDSEFRYVDRPFPSVQGLDDSGSIIYIGTFSKVLFPSLRLGYVVVPHKLLNLFRKLKEIASGPAPAINQATTALFIEEGFFAMHVRRMRKIYLERRDSFIYEGKKYLSGLIDIPSIDAGMDAIGWLRLGENDVDLSQRFQAAGFDTPPLSIYSLRPCKPGLVFGFTAFTPAQIRLAMQTLSNSIQ